MLTTETLFGGQITIQQKEKGYRFSTDAIILAAQVVIHDNDTAVELGTGCGIIPILLAHRNPSVQIIGIEIQQELASIARSNVTKNGMSERISILNGDIKDMASLVRSDTADVVFCNPPYRSAQAGRVSPNVERALARHELSASISDVLSAARYVLKASGRLSVIFPANRLVDLVSMMRAFDLEPKRIRLVHSKIDTPAELVYAEGYKGGRPGIMVLPPLCVHTRDGRFTPELEEMLDAGC